jgi:uncharacterized iron-regulated membrane protein
MLRLESCVSPELAHRPVGISDGELWNREIHTGDIGGLGTRILVCAVSLTLSVMAITGPFIWWNRRRQSVERL